MERFWAVHKLRSKIDDDRRRMIDRATENKETDLLEGPIPVEHLRCPFAGRKQDAGGAGEKVVGEVFRLTAEAPTYVPCNLTYEID